jgi:hypothetical protein
MNMYLMLTEISNPGESSSSLGCLELRDFEIRNVMIADDGMTPILMDFGSAMKARVRVETRSQALLQQVKRPVDSDVGSYWFRCRTLRPSKVQWLIEHQSFLMSKLV